jgi:hypothetical protein
MEKSAIRIYTFESVNLSMVNKSKTSSAKRKTTTKTQKQSKENQHSEKQFSETISKALVEGGLHCVASKHHGKTRLLFNMVKHLRNLDNCRVLIFDGSLAWLYGFDRIPVLTVKEHDITLADRVNTTQDIERYKLENWEIAKLAMQKHKDLLFRLKTRKPSKRGFFVRTIVNYLDRMQKPKQFIAYFIEEAQDAFNSRSTVRLEAEEFLTVFNEARNQKEAFFTASQRLNDFSKTIRTKQLYCIGRINPEDKTSFLRRIEKKQEIDFSAMPQRKWFFEGKLFLSPNWKQSGKPYQINKQLKAEFAKPQQKKIGILERIKKAFEQKTAKSEETEKPDFEKIEFPEETEYPDSSDSDLIEFGL